MLNLIIVCRQIRQNGDCFLLIYNSIKCKIHDLYLLTTTADEFFQKPGLEKIDREQTPQEIRKSRQFSDICPESAVIMHLKIS